MSVLVRPAAAEDHPALADIQRRAVEVCLRPLYDSGAIDRWIESLSVAKFERAVALGETILVALCEDAVVGFVSYRVETGLVGMWYVDPESIGRGIGSMLLGAAEASLLESGCTLATTEASLFARPMFEARGWAVVGPFDKEAFGGTFRVMRMEKALSAF